MLNSFSRNYDYYKTILYNVQKPLAYVDLDFLNQNIDSVLKRSSHQKNIRIATKSVRCVYLLNYILSKSTKFCGLMSYDGDETMYLLRHGFDNILIGYPIVDAALIEKLVLEIKNGKKICFMVDIQKHVQILESIAQKHNTCVSICLDINLSQKYPFLYFGAHRSSLDTEESLHKICEEIKKCQHLNLQGIMGYEAQIAGLGDNTKGKFLKNLVIRFLKYISVKKIWEVRQAYYEIVKQYGFKLDFVNGGGSGSIETTIQDSAVTEITVGSAFYSPHLLDDFYQFKHLPAAGFAVEITRQPKPNIFTALGGGYHSSGSDGQHKTPKPFLPQGIFLLANESAGEVQTPFFNNGKTLLQIGDPVLMRHAKAGEMCERFNKLYLISDGEIKNIVNTYRGDGLCTL